MIKINKAEGLLFEIKSYSKATVMQKKESINMKKV